MDPKTHCKNMNEQAKPRPWFTGVGIFVAAIAIALTFTTLRTDVSISFQLLPYFAAASLSAILLGLAGRHRRESLWLCVSSITLGAVGLAFEYTVFAAIFAAVMMLALFVGDLSSMDWLVEIVLGLIVVVFGLMLAGVSLPVILTVALVIGAIAFLSDFLNFF